MSPIALSRRQALSALSLSAAGALAASDAFGETVPGRPLLLPSANACVLTPQAAEGPYSYDPKLERSDVREDKPGVPLRLRLQVLEAASCAPIARARIDLWQSDATGHYSGYEHQGDTGDESTVGATFLRGTQFTDDAGQAGFVTIYPGWYRGRTPHIHFRVILDAASVLVGQIYFPDALSEFIFEHVAPYNERTGQRDTVNTTDGVLRRSGGSHGSFCNIKEEADHYLASLVIGVDRGARVVADAPAATEAPSPAATEGEPGAPPTDVRPMEGPGPVRVAPELNSALVPGAG